MDIFTREKRSWIMSQVKSSGNKTTEQQIIGVLRRNKVTGWRRNYAIFGKPDIAFPKCKVAIFVDGYFWHGHPDKCRIPKTNRKYWLKKIVRNKERDARVNTVLRENGWKVVRIWEGEVNKQSTLSRIRRALRQYETSKDSR